MKRILLVFLGIIPIFLSAQNVRSDFFENGLEWRQALEKAKIEDKMIFVDCFATWCLPCKKMDRLVYSNDSLDRFMRQHFVSLKIQIDTTKDDEEFIKSYYGIADSLMRAYSIGKLPFFLFFSANGRIVHKGIGYMDAKHFLDMATDAMQPSKQYYSKLRSYNLGEMSYAEMPDFSRQAMHLGDPKVAKSVGDNYVDHYLSHLDSVRLFMKDNLQLLFELAHSVNGFGFLILKRYSALLDSILGPNVAQRKMISIIDDDYTEPAIQQMIPDINWSLLDTKLTNDFGHLGVIEYREKRLGYAWVTDNWKDFEKFYILYFQIVDSLNVYDINNASWNIFLHSSNPVALKMALKVVESHKSRSENVESLDTYANLLYKLHKRALAMKWEEKAVEMENRNSVAQKRDPDGIYWETLQKMKDGVKTW